MNTPTILLSKIKNIYTYLALILGIASNAQVQEPFTPRYSEAIRGDITIIANNMISRTSTNNYNGGGNNHDFSNNVYVDIDNDNSTFNSSSANFTNPEINSNCTTIIKAFLYWAAGDKEKNNGDDNQPNWNFDDIKLMLPGENTYTTITADEIIYRGRDNHFSNEPYVCIKDISSNIASLPDIYGTYQVANVEGKIGSLIDHNGGNTGTSGGWQIVFVYKSPDLPSKNITLFDGYAHVTSSINNFDINFSGFQTIPTGNVNAKLVIGSLEGDRGLNGDKLQILNSTNNYVNITAPLRNANNFFNSRITVGNANFIDRNPASTNTLGYDAAVFNLDNPNNSIITNNQTDATIRLTSNQETYGLFLVGLSVETWEPNLGPIPINLNSGNNPASPGDTIGIDFNILNSGNDDAVNVVLETILPLNVSFSSANLPNGVTYSYNSSSRELLFYIEDGFVDVGDSPLNISFDILINDECYFLEDTCALFVDIQFTATYNGFVNPNQHTTISSTILDSCNPLPFIVDITQPVVNWSTNAGELDSIIECDDSVSLNNAQTMQPTTDKCIFTLSKTSGPFVQDPDCPGAGSYTNLWNFTDACGVSISDFQQIITVVDTTPPTASNPPASFVQCSNEIPEQDVTVVTDAYDSCSNPSISFISDVSDNQTCPETIIRSYSVSDACGNSIIVTQPIYIIDDIKPKLESELVPVIYITCEEIPEIPSLEFSDNCTPNLNIDFDEIITQNDEQNFDISRVWTISDSCNNQNIFTQSIYVNRINESNAQYIDLCIEDDPLDVYSLVPYEEVSNINTQINEWNSDSIELLVNGMFDPGNILLGDYEFINRITNNDCTWTTTIYISVHDDCVSFPCLESTSDVTISKMVTPNNDGFNDFFEVDYILNEESNDICDVETKVQIFNRWGIKIFESNNYQNNWSGIAKSTSTNSSGHLPTGTYYYIVELVNGGLKPIQGFIYLGTE